MLRAIHWHGQAIVRVSSSCMVGLPTFLHANGCLIPSLPPITSHHHCQASRVVIVVVGKANSLTMPTGPA